MALKEIFINTNINGCFFHFSQILFRKIQKRNLIIQYKTNPKFCECYCLIHALAIVPLNYFKEEIEKLENFLSKSKIEKIWEIWLDFKKYYCLMLIKNQPSLYFQYIFDQL
ncbi:hypothetical protein DMUE_0797 [Dictyocoela muelleri]|nr:hypothetical protein DMUE_0797 [Dictyocoela muelleri]